MEARAGEAGFEISTALWTESCDFGIGLVQSVAALVLIGAATQGLKYPLDCGLSLVISASV